MKNEIKTTVRNFIIDNFFFGDTSRTFEDGDSFLENGIVDSTGILEVIDFLEEQYGITIEDEEMLPENLDSLYNISEFVSKKSQEKVAAVGNS